MIVRNCLLFHFIYAPSSLRQKASSQLKQYYYKNTINEIHKLKFTSEITFKNRTNFFYKIFGVNLWDQNVLLSLSSPLCLSLSLTPTELLCCVYCRFEMPFLFVQFVAFCVPLSFILLLVSIAPQTTYPYHPPTISIPIFHGKLRKVNQSNCCINLYLSPHRVHGWKFHPITIIIIASHHTTRTLTQCWASKSRETRDIYAIFIYLYIYTPI